MTEKTEWGLTSQEAAERLKQYGPNEPIPQKRQTLFRKILFVLRQPMFLLLLAAALIYFLLGEARDGGIMLVFVLGILSIDVVQEWKTDRTLSALRELTTPQATVYRDGAESILSSMELVPGDVIRVEEGVKIPADGRVLHANDLRVDESTLTGEPEAVWKTPAATQAEGENAASRCYAGTLVIQGSGLLEIDATGPATEYGKIGGQLTDVPNRPTPLQRQTGKLVKICAVIAMLLFALVTIITFCTGSGRLDERLSSSVLSGITLAMAMIPEEFPVVLTVFLSMGAWRLARKNSLVRRLPSVETLGAVSVLCVDKTGTLTENRMTVQDTWPAAGIPDGVLWETMGLGCEPDAYDPMERAMLTFCEEHEIPKAHLFSGELLAEYPFTDKGKRMGHLWLHEGRRIVAAKGSPEGILPLCHLDRAKRREAEEKSASFSRKGLRVIAVASYHPGEGEEALKRLEDYPFTFLGLVGLMDPLRKGVKEEIGRCREAGIRVVMITGDNGLTAASIARQAGIPAEQILTGEDLEGMGWAELCRAARTVGVFSRVIPEHKLRIVKALQANGEVVAMTGDGVNDAPALRHADIGIAMGKRGAEVAREASDLILMDDNFSTIVDTVRDGRRIYDNIRKAIGYILAIHVPIALSSLLAPLLGIASGGLLLLPVHIVLMELVIDPTCSIVFERQPSEGDILHRAPRRPNEKILDGNLAWLSLLQGFIIFLASFGLYYFSLGRGVTLARSLGIATLLLANLFLVLVNGSSRGSIIHTLRPLFHDWVMRLMLLVSAGGLLIMEYTPLSSFLKLSPLSFPQLLLVIAVSAAAVFWFELVKLFRRRRER